RSQRQVWLLNPLRLRNGFLRDRQQLRDDFPQSRARKALLDPAMERLNRFDTLLRVEPAITGVGRDCCHLSGETRLLRTPTQDPQPFDGNVSYFDDMPRITAAISLTKVF